jgi:TraM recognition site of TraD and TraG
MSRIREMGKELRRQVRASVRGLPAAPALSRHDPTALVLGRDSGQSPVSISLGARLRHTHAVGTTGSGKTKFFEHCILQDIAAGRGVCVVDPHGNHPDSLYRSLLSWIAKWEGRIDRPVHLIDPNTRSHTVGFNPLAIPRGVDPSVIGATALEAFERAWGDEDTNTKPTLQRVLFGTFVALAEAGLTLAEARLLFDRKDAAGVRAHVLKSVSNQDARDLLARLSELSSSQTMFDAEVIAPRNRISKLTRNPALRAIVGQTGNTIDFRGALDEGHIILVNLSGGDLTYETDADLLGRLLVRFLFFHAKRRAHPERPFFLYLDECQRYLSGDVPQLLAEARKYGLGAVLGHQYLRQLGEPHDEIRQAVLNTTNCKVVFGLRHPAEAQELAEMILRPAPETPVEASIRPTVVGHHKVTLRNTGEADHAATSESVGHAVGDTVAEGGSVGYSRMSSASVGRSVSSFSGKSEASGHANSSMAGSVSGYSEGQVMAAPDANLLFPDTPAVLSVSAGDSMAHTDSSGSSDSVMHGTSRARGRGESWSRSQGEASSEVHSTMRARAETRSNSSSTTTGTTRNKGESEAFEPIYENLPTSFHSKESVLWVQGDLLRSLPPGTAIVSFGDGARRESTMLKVPLVTAPRLADADFETLRARFLDAASSARPAADASRIVEERERSIIAAAAVALASPREPASFREPVRKPRTPKT